MSRLRMLATVASTAAIDGIQMAGVILLTPAVLLHELTHLLVSYPWFDIEDVALAGTRAGVAGRWRPGTPAWAVVLGHFAPTLCGLLVALLAAWMQPTTPHWFLGALVVANWLVYTYPGADDRDLSILRTSATI